jgi:hypothetical protein
MGVLQGAEDYTRIFLNSAMGGLPNMIGEHAAQNAAELQAARQRTGFGGSLANVAGWVAPVSAALKVPRAIGAGVRAAPTALEAIPAAERAVTSILPQSGRALARARLGLPELPTISETLGKNIVGAVKAHPIKSALAAIGVPLAALADYGGGDASTPAAAAPSAAKATPAAKAASPAAAKSAAADNASPLDQLVGMVAKSQGGKISLSQLAAIGDFTSKVSPEIRHPPTYKDLAAAELTKNSQDSFNTLIGQAQAAKASGDTKTATALQQQALDQRRADLLSIMGQDPQSLMLAQRMQELQNQQGN